VYRYYQCSGKLKRGACEGGQPVRVREELLNDLVMDRLLNELLTPEFVHAIVATVAERRNDGRADSVASLERLRSEERQVGRRLRAMMDALADGMVESDDIFRDKYASFKKERESIERMIVVHERAIAETLNPISITQASVAAARLRAKLLQADAKLKKRLVRAIVMEVRVGRDEIDIYGPKSALAELATGTPFEAAPSARKFGDRKHG
jgi:hypothetical protein